MGPVRAGIRTSLHADVYLDTTASDGWEGSPYVQKQD